MAEFIYFTCRTVLIFYILKNICLPLILFNETSSARVSKVKILRSIDGRVDRIRFPRQLCKTTSAADIGCDVMQKRKGQSCSCICNVTNPTGTSYVKNTVVFSNGSWQCMDNLQVRWFAGCNFSPISETLHDPIPDISRKPFYVLKPPVPYQRCRINALESAFLRCNGTWKRLREEVLRRFVNTSTKFTKDQVIIKFTGNSAHPTVHGKVIRLAVSCKKQGKVYQNVGCVLVKVKGKMRCRLLTSPKPTHGSQNTTINPSPRNLATMSSPKPLPSRHLQRPKIGASKTKRKKQGAFAVEDERVAHSLPVAMGAFAAVLLVVMIVSAFVVVATRRKLNSLDDKWTTNQTESKRR